MSRRAKDRIRRNAKRYLLPQLWADRGGACERCRMPTVVPRAALADGWVWDTRPKRHGWLVRGEERVKGASVEHHHGVLAGNGPDNLRLYCMPCNRRSANRPTTTEG